MRKNWRPVWIASVVALTCAPYFWAFGAAPPRCAYNWILPPYADDLLAYMAWVKQAALGAWLFKIKFTASPQPAILFQPYFLAAGLIGRATGAGPGFVLFLLRGAGAAWFLGAFERFTRRFDLTPSARALALAFVSVSSGWGFLQAWGWLRPPLTPGYSADLWLVDVSTLWSLTWNPVYPVALALMLTILDPWLEKTPTDRRLVLAGALASLLALIHPYDVAVVAVVAAAAALGRPRRAVRELSLFALAAAPGVLYQLWVLTRDPVLARHAESGLMLSPTPAALLWGFGFPGVLAVMGAGFLAGRRRLREFAPPLVWISCALAAAYLPVWFQRKFLLGLHLPLCLLAGVGADAVLERAAALASRRRSAAYAALASAAVLLTIPTHLSNLRRTLGSLRAAGGDGPFYVGAEWREAFAAMAARGRPDDAAFAEPSASLLIPAWSGNTVVSGHWAQSVDSDEVQARIREALTPGAGLDDRARRERLLGAGIAYVVFSGGLRAAVGGAVPRWLIDSADVVFQGPTVQVYRLR